MPRSEPTPSCPRRVGVAVLTFAALLSTGDPAWSDSTSEALTATAEIEARLLEAEMLRYTELRRAVTAARNAHDALDRQLDSAVVGESLSTEDLRDLEARAAAARDNAYGLARQSETVRRAIYAQMDRIAELRGAGDRFASRAPKSPLEGVWSFSTSAGESGYVRLSADGALVRGTYRLDDGGSGSLRGTLVDGVVELEQISGGQGFDRLLTGNLEGTTLEGQWVATELSGGRPESGSWTGRKLSAAEARAVDPPR